MQCWCMGPVYQQQFFLYLATLYLSLIKYCPNLPVFNILANWIIAQSVIAGGQGT